MKNIQQVQTQDGSPTWFNVQVGEHYHNLNGAYTESKEVYLETLNLPNLLASRHELSILDPFFGLGYNTWSTMEAFLKLSPQFPNARLKVFAIERDPEILAEVPLVLEAWYLNNLNSFLSLAEHNTYYQTLRDHLNLNSDLASNNAQVAENIAFNLLVDDVRHALPEISNIYFDCIFHDAFSPSKQPELWTKQLFEAYYKLLNPTCGMVITYSAAASVRNAFKECGFYVYPLQNANLKPGTIACVQENLDFIKFSELEMALMYSKSGIPYYDNDSLTREPSEIVSIRNKYQAESTLLSSTAVHTQYGHIPKPRHPRNEKT